jgi:hypothetical protein
MTFTPGYRTVRNHLALALLLGVASSSFAIDRFSEGATFMRQGRFAEAYGRFILGASDGDSDAARLALHMHQYGPQVYGSHWDASAEDLQLWSRLAIKPSRRGMPAFLPQPRARAAVAPRRLPQPQQAPAS